MLTSGPSFLPATRSADDVCTALPSYVMVHVSNGFTHRNASPPAPSTVGLALGSFGGQRRTIAAKPVHPPVRKGDVDLDVVVVPVGGDGFDPDARETDVTAIVHGPEADRVPHLGILGALRKDEFAGRVDSAGQIGGHWFLS